MKTIWFWISYELIRYGDFIGKSEANCPFNVDTVEGMNQALESLRKDILSANPQGTDVRIINMHTHEWSDRP